MYLLTYLDTCVNSHVYLYVCAHFVHPQMTSDVFSRSISPGSWWRFAFNVVLHRVSEHRKRQTWAFVASRAQLNVQYVRAYTWKLTEAVVDADTSVSRPSSVAAASPCVSVSVRKHLPHPPSLVIRLFD